MKEAEQVRKRRWLTVAGMCVSKLNGPDWVRVQLGLMGIHAA